MWGPGIIFIGLRGYLQMLRHMHKSEHRQESVSFMLADILAIHVGSGRLQKEKLRKHIANCPFT